MPEPISTQHYPTLADRGFRIERGWSEELADQLVERSREPYIRSQTPRDADERFNSSAAASEWYESKEPTVYALAKAANLAGVIWFSKRERNDMAADHTFAIRLYPGARGEGIAEPFARTAEADYTKIAQPYGIWLETEMSNSSARNLYRKLGYKVVAASTSRITMAR